MFASLFGRKPAAVQETKTCSTSEVTDAIIKLRDSIEIIEKKIAANDKRVLALESDAKECAKAGNKPKAMAILKKKKLLTDSNVSLESQKMNLELQCMEIENLNMNKEIINSFQTSTNLIKKFHKANDIDKVEDMMESFAENMDDLRQVTATLSRPIVAIDEDELESELDGLMQADIDKQLLDVGGAVPNMPSVPTTKIPIAAQAAESEDDREIRELLASMN
jgi:hypothetical protein